MMIILQHYRHAYIIMIVSLVAPLSIAFAPPCSVTTTPVCQSCTCYDSSEYETSTGGVFFYETFHDLPSGWTIHDNDRNNNSFFLFEKSLALIEEDLTYHNADDWFLSPPIATDTVGLEDLLFTFSFQRNDENAGDYVSIHILEHDNATNMFFTGEYSNSLIITSSDTTGKEKNCRNCHSGRYSHNTNITMMAENLVDAFVEYGTERIYTNKFPVENHEFLVQDSIGKMIRIGIQYRGQRVLLDELALYYQMSVNETAPTTDDFSTSTSCCGGNDDIGVFIPGQTWGGYSKDCNGDQLNAIDFYVYEVDVPNKYITGRTSVLPNELTEDCYGSWNNTLNYNALTNAWEFGQGIPNDARSSSCNDRISLGKGILCIGSDRPALCGRSSKEQCDLIFSLRRSVQPNEQYVHILGEERELVPLKGTLENRWARAASIETGEQQLLFAIDDFGRIHTSQYSRAFNSTDSRSVVLKSMLGKEVVGLNSGKYVTIFRTRHGAVYIFNFEEGGFNPSRMLFIPTVDIVWSGSYSAIARTSKGDMWGWGDNSYGELSFLSLNTFIKYPSPLTELNDMLKYDIVGPFIDVAIGDSQSTFVASNNSLYICGYNSQSQLRLRSVERVSKPKLHPLVSSVINCGCGSFHAYCTSNRNTIIGFGTAVVAASSEPMEYSYLSDSVVMSVSSRTLINIATTINGSIYLWGVIPDQETILEPALIEETKDTPMAITVPGYDTLIMVKDHVLGVSYAQTDFEVFESDGVIEIPVERSSNDNNIPITIYVSAYLSTESILPSQSHRRSNVNIGSFVLLTNTIQWDADESEIKFIKIKLLDDSIYVSRKEILVGMTREGLVTTTTTRITVLDDGDAGKLCFTYSNINVVEDQGSISIRLNRTDGSSSDVYAVVSVSNDTGNAKNQIGILSGNGDFVFYQTTVTWLDGDSNEKNIIVPILDDNVYESVEAFSLRMNPHGGAIVDPECRNIAISITDSLNRGEIRFQEKYRNIEEVGVEITRTGGNSGIILVKIESLNQHPDPLPPGATIAINGKDYMFNETNVQFKEGDSVPKLIRVKLLENNVPGLKVIHLLLTDITAQVMDSIIAESLFIKFGDNVEEKTDAAVSGSIVGAISGSVVIGAFAFLLRSYRRKKESLRNQWLILFEQLEDVEYSDYHLYSTATYLSREVFLEHLDPHICQESEETFIKFVSLHHTNLVIFIGVCFSPSLLITEYCNKGGLDEALRDGKIPFQTDFKASLCCDAAQGMSYLHAKGISHGMLDLSKLLVNSRCVCKIAGVALQAWNLRHSSRDSVCWLAPEQLQAMGPRILDESWSGENSVPRVMESSKIEVELSDLYSFGMIVFAIFTENPYPYTEVVHRENSSCFQRESLRVEIMNNSLRPHMPHNLTDPVVGIWDPDGYEMKTMEQAQRCWAGEPIMRPPFPELADFFQSMLPSNINIMENMMSKYASHIEEIVTERINELRREREDTEEVLSKVHSLVHNVLPEHVVNRLHRNSNYIVDKYDSATVFYSEIAKFDDIIKRNNPTDVILLLNGVFSSIDTSAEKYQMEHIKTFGDAYLAICGSSTMGNAERTLLFALEVMEGKFQTVTGQICHLRIGIDIGLVYVGVIGSYHLSYDLWGPALKVASSIGHICLENKVCVSKSIYEKLQPLQQFAFVVSPVSKHYIIGGGSVYVVMAVKNLMKEQH